MLCYGMLCYSMTYTICNITLSTSTSTRRGSRLAGALWLRQPLNFRVSTKTHSGFIANKQTCFFEISRGASSSPRQSAGARAVAYKSGLFCVLETYKLPILCPRDLGHNLFYHFYVLLGWGRWAGLRSGDQTAGAGAALRGSGAGVKAFLSGDVRRS